MRRKRSSKTVSQTPENLVVEQEKPSFTVKKPWGGEIDEIFSVKKSRKPGQRKAEQTQTLGIEIEEIFSGKKRKPEREQKAGDKITAKSNKMQKTKFEASCKGPKDIHGSLDVHPTRARKKMGDGLVIYTEEELGIRKADAGACASCKHKRKICDQDCQLARYFPQSRYEDYLNCYRLFGTKNMIRILNSVEIHERDETVETLILEASMRRASPVHGSLQMNRWLETQINACEKELDDVKKQLDYFKKDKSQMQQLDFKIREITKLLAVITPGMEQIGEMDPSSLENNHKDPPHDEVHVHEAIDDFRGAEVMMITGDNQSIVEAICREIRLFSQEEVLSGRSTTGPCASCKHRRTRCGQDCQLARYFPASRCEDYLNCHRHFGMSNMVKILNSVQIHVRDETAATLILEARMWRDNPVHGSLPKKWELETQISAYEKELDDVNEKLDYFKKNHSQMQQPELESSGITKSLAITPPGTEEQIGEVSLSSLENNHKVTSPAPSGCSSGREHQDISLDELEVTGFP